jgi:hypothetical protein
MPQAIYSLGVTVAPVIPTCSLYSGQSKSHTGREPPTADLSACIYISESSILMVVSDSITCFTQTIIFMVKARGFDGIVGKQPGAI